MGKKNVAGGRGKKPPRRGSRKRRRIASQRPRVSFIVEQPIVAPDDGDIWSVPMNCGQAQKALHHYYDHGHPITATILKARLHANSCVTCGAYQRQLAHYSETSFLAAEAARARPAAITPTT